MGEFEKGPEPDPELVRLLIEAVSKNDADLVQVGVVSVFGRRIGCFFVNDMLVELDH